MRLLQAICVLSLLFVLACGGSSSKSDVAGIADTSVTADQTATDEQQPPADTLDTVQAKDIPVTDVLQDKSAEDFGADLIQDKSIQDNSGEDLGTDLPGDTSVEDLAADVLVLDDLGDDLADAAEEDQGPPKPTGTVVPGDGSTVYAHTPIVITFDQQMSNGTEQFSGTIIAVADAGKAKSSWDVINGKDTLTITPESAWELGDDMTLTVTVSAPDFPDMDYTVTLTYKVLASVENGMLCKGSKQCINSICCGDKRCGGDTDGNCCDDPDCSDDKWCDKVSQTIKAQVTSYSCLEDREPGEGCSRNEQCKANSCGGAKHCNECGTAADCPDNCNAETQVKACCKGVCACNQKPTLCRNPPCIIPGCLLVLCKVGQSTCHNFCCDPGEFCHPDGCKTKRKPGEPCLYRDNVCLSGICRAEDNTCACSDESPCDGGKTCQNGVCVN